MSTRKNIQIISAPSILGLRPTGVETLADCLLSAGLVDVLKSKNEVVHVPTLNYRYEGKRDHFSHVLNEPHLKTFSEVLGTHLISSVKGNTFPLVLGGDCSILIGVMAALKSIGKYGLIFLDAHADFYLPHQSITGEAADMDLAIVTGSGSEVLTNINNARPYVDEGDVFHLGQRDEEEAERYHSLRIQDTRINCYSYRKIASEGIESIVNDIISQAKKRTVTGFWIHFDTDVISDHENPAVDYRLPGGLTFAECSILFKTLMLQLPITGMTVTIYNPTLDPEKRVVGPLIKCLTQGLIQ